MENYLHQKRSSSVDIMHEIIAFHGGFQSSSQRNSARITKIMHAQKEVEM